MNPTAPDVLTPPADTLTRLTDAVRRSGKMGVVILHHGGGLAPYLAACMNAEGKISDPRNWNTQPTAEAAVADLLDRIESADVRRVAG